MGKEKIPCIKCTPELWEYIKPYLERWGYKIQSVSNFAMCPLVVINRGENFGFCTNLIKEDSKHSNRELVTNVEEFLERAAKLKGFTYKRKDMKEFTKADLKPGMVVEDREGNRYLVCKFNESIKFISEEEWNPISGFRDDLTCITYPKFDIMKVYNPINVSGLTPLLANHGNILSLIWERKEPKEYTMQEIADKLGIPVEQLRIKK